MRDDDTEAPSDNERTDVVANEPSWNPLTGNPRLQIWLVVAVFYAILASMFLFVMVLILRG